MDDGDTVRVQLIRGHFKRNIFGHASYFWTARVSGDDWMHELVAGQDASAKHLALRGIHLQEATD